MTKNILEHVKDDLHENHRDLTGAWAQKAPAVFLENRSVNAEEQIVNGAKGGMESLLWIEKMFKEKWRD